MKEIKLSKYGRNRGKYVALVDDEDFDYLNQFSWYAWNPGKTIYAVRNITINKVDCKIYMHRIIMQTPVAMEVDHIDFNGLNNQKYNLRNCTLGENRRNTRARGELKSLGVSMAYGKYKAQIRHNGRVRHIGLFNSELEAARAYDTKAKELHGEFANLNFK